MFPSFFFFLLSAFFFLSFSSLPLLFDILKPKKVPTRRGLWLVVINRKKRLWIAHLRVGLPSWNPPKISTFTWGGKVGVQKVQAYPKM